MRRAVAARSARSPRKPAARPRRRRMRIWRYVFLVCASMMTVTGAAGIGLLMGFVRTLPPISQLENYDPPEVTRVTDRSGQDTIGEFKKDRRYVVPISQIPKRLQLAFLAIEDSRFYNHFGVDVIGILRALVTDLRTGSMAQGASTITQQLTRNILPVEVGNKRTLTRKIKEALLSLQIERRYSKDQILEFYLNHIEFLYQAFGVKAAASTYFSKDLDELDLAECATLAAMPKNPVLFDPIRHPKRTQERRNVVLARMLELGYIGKDAYDQAVAEPLVTHRSYGAPSLYPYFIDALWKDLVHRYGLDPTQLRQGGFRLTATVDGQIQQDAVEALREGLIRVERMWQSAKPARHYEETKKWSGVLRKGDTFLMKITKVRGDSVDVALDDYHGTIPLPEELPYYEPANIIEQGEWLDVRVTDVAGGGKIEGVIADTRPVQGSIVVLDAHTAEVLALVGGANFYSSRGGQYNIAIQGGRQPGSAMKPFFYAAAMQRKIPPDAIIVDEPVEYGPIDRPYRPINYEKNFEGPMTLIEALEHSRNVVTIRLFEALGIKKALEEVRQFDFTHEGAEWKMPPELPVALGTIDATPLEIASAYQVFANSGVAVRPEFFRSMLDKDGQVAVPVRHWEEPIIDPIAAYQTVYMLRQVVLGGTGKTEIGDKFPSPPYPPICGKTGTTTDNRDCWFVGFTPDLVIAVQVGFDPPRSLGPKLTGGRVAGPIWADLFKRVLKTRSNWAMKFDVPEGVELADICGNTGKLVSDVCAQEDHKIFRGVPFRLGQVPDQKCNDVPLTPLIAPVSAAYADEGTQSPIQGFARRRSLTADDSGDSDGGDSDTGIAPGMFNQGGGAPPAVPAVQL